MQLEYTGKIKSIYWCWRAIGLATKLFRDIFKKADINYNWLFSHNSYNPLVIILCSALQVSFSENQSSPTAPSPVHLSSVQEIQQFGQL